MLIITFIYFMIEYTIFLFKIEYTINIIKKNNFKFHF
jgi:hypothetical protein